MGRAKTGFSSCWTDLGRGAGESLERLPLNSSRSVPLAVSVSSSVNFQKSFGFGVRLVVVTSSGENEKRPPEHPGLGMLWGSLICCLVVAASHGPLRAQRGGIAILLGLGAAALRLGLTGADTGSLAGLFLHLRLGAVLCGLPLCLVRRRLHQPQHELPLGQPPGLCVESRAPGAP